MRKDGREGEGVEGMTKAGGGSIVNKVDRREVGRLNKEGREG